MIPTFDILIGRLLMHEHSEYVLKGTPGYVGIFGTPGDLPSTGNDGDFCLIRSTGTFWWWDISVTPSPDWTEISGGGGINHFHKWYLDENLEISSGESYIIDILHHVDGVTIEQEDGGHLIIL